MQSSVVKAGTLLHSETPYVHLLLSSLRKERCDYCYEKDRLFICTGCNYVKYCDKACQKAGWNFHKFECPNLKRIPPDKTLPDSARFMARVIMKLKKGGGGEKGHYGNANFRVWKDLMSHYSDVKEDSKRMEHFLSLYSVLLWFIGESNLPNVAECIGIYGRMLINSFNILDPEMVSLGTGIYLGASTIDHSCTPNAIATFNGATIEIRAMEDIPQFSWSKIRIPYIDLMKTRKERMSDLRSQYYFDCECPRCSNTEEDNFSAALLCPECNGNVPQSNFSCEVCGVKLSPELILKFTEVEQLTLLQHHNMKDTAYFDACKMCMDKQTGLFHPLNILHLKTLDLAFESGVLLGIWEQVERIGIQLIPGYRKYYGEKHPLLGILLTRLGKVLLYNGKPKEACEYLSQAEEIIKITHGLRHTFYINSLVPLLFDAKMSFEANNTN